jgi:hypothetical protein
MKSLKLLTIKYSTSCDAGKIRPVLKTAVLLTFSVPRFKWPVSFTGPDLNARIRAGRACFY